MFTENRGGGGKRWWEGEPAKGEGGCLDAAQSIVSRHARDTVTDSHGKGGGLDRSCRDIGLKRIRASAQTWRHGLATGANVSRERERKTPMEIRSQQKVKQSTSLTMWSKRPRGAAGWARLGRSRPAPERESRQAYTEIPVPYIQPLLAEQQN